jgi:uncharacterized membrane protein YhaH (DUF805 family)
MSDNTSANGPGKLPQYRRQLNPKATDLHETKASPIAPLNNDGSSLILNCFARLIDFNGTAGVLEFLLYVLLYIPLMLVLIFIPGYILCVFLKLEPHLIIKIGHALSCILSIPLLAVCVRRLHDTNKSALYLLIVLIPLGQLALLILLLFPGDYSLNNEYRKSRNIFS